jgi:alkylation response protein AidB-like acyl-CoA dehydrogenase
MLQSAIGMQEMPRAPGRDRGRRPHPRRRPRSLRKSRVLPHAAAAALRRYEFGLPTFAKVTIELSRGCPSTGWSVIFTAGHTHQPSIPSRPRARSTASRRSPRTDGRARTPWPEGRWRPLISGAWDYASGIDVATHFSPPRRFGTRWMKNPGHSPAALRPRPVRGRSQLKMFGMQGSGSHRVVIKDQFVPDHRVSTRNLLVPSITPPESRLFDNPITRRAQQQHSHGRSAAVAVGTGYAALDCTRRSCGDARRRTRQPGPGTASSRSTRPGAGLAGDREPPCWAARSRVFFAATKWPAQAFHAGMSQRIVLVDNPMRWPVMRST